MLYKADRLGDRPNVVLNSDTKGKYLLSAFFYLNLFRVPVLDFRQEKDIVTRRTLFFGN
jgi:hypothetical protein